VRKSTAAELKQNREMLHHFCDGVDCWFCQLSLLENNSETFGHRDHQPITTKLTIHHVNENHEDNRKSNRVPCHQSCHKSYHAKRILHGKSMRRALLEVRAEIGGR
jgi:hypothetical protein